MRLNRLQQVGGPSIMQEKQALSETPERGRAELVRTGRPLTYAIGKPRSHVVQRKVGIRGIGKVGHTGELCPPGRESCCMTKRTTDAIEQVGAIGCRVRHGGRRGWG